MINTKQGNVLVWLIVIIAFVALGWWLLGSRSSDTTPSDGATTTDEVMTHDEGAAAGDAMTSEPSDSATEETSPTSGDTLETVVVTYTDSGFSPQEVTVSQGQTVRFVNESGHQMWVASAQHPTHVVYSGTSLSEHCPDTSNTSFDECTGVGNGGSWEFTFTKAGTWGYHNHLLASHFGKVTVVAVQ